MKPKIVQVIPSLRTGGAESLVKNYLLNYDAEKYDFKAFVMGVRSDTLFEKVLLEKGVNVTFLGELYKKSRIKGKIGHIIDSFRWRKAVKNYFKKEKPSVVHCHLHVGQMIVSAIKELKDSKLFYTVHSDPDKYWGDGKNLKEIDAVKKIHKFNKITFFALDSNFVFKVKKYFGEDTKVEVLYNCVDTKSFTPNAQKRAVYREELKVDDNTLVVGHVGRFTQPKNHSFIIDVFSAIHSKNENTRLVLAGEGELKKKIQKKVKDLSLDSSVSFLGNRSDVSDLISAFDCFLFPSLWEGLPLTLIEAQSAELPCFVSDTVTKEVDCSNLVNYLSLDIGADKWAETILNYKKKPVEYNGLSKYDVGTILNKLTEIYGV